MKNLFCQGSAYLLMCVMFFSCAHNNQLEAEKIQSARRIRSLESNLKKQQVAINNLKEQNWILKQKYLADNHSSAQKIPVPFQPSAAISPEDASKAPVSITAPVEILAATPPAPAITTASLAPAAQPMPAAISVQPAPPAAAKAEETLAATPTDSRESAEHNLYAKVIASYRQKRSADLKRVTEILLKTYPQSVFADRAIFLNARLDFENADDQAAIGECERIIRLYPNASKMASTYLLKAQILKKQGRLNEAKSILADVQTYYPGSPEAFRVPLELKLLSLQAKATK